MMETSSRGVCLACGARNPSEFCSCGKCGQPLLLGVDFYSRLLSVAGKTVKENPRSCEFSITLPPQAWHTTTAP